MTGALDGTLNVLRDTTSRKKRSTARYVRLQTITETGIVTYTQASHTGPLHISAQNGGTPKA